jgi:hypothetical protein
MGSGNCRYGGRGDSDTAEDVSDVPAITRISTTPSFAVNDHDRAVAE